MKLCKIYIVKQIFMSVTVYILIYLKDIFVYNGERYIKRDIFTFDLRF